MNLGRIMITQNLGILNGEKLLSERADNYMRITKNSLIHG